MENERTKNSARNALHSIINLALTLVLQFISRTVFIVTLGNDYLGVNGLFNNVISLLNMVDLGIGTAVIFSFYRPLAEKDYQKVSSLLRYYKKIYNAIAACVLTLGLAIIPILKYIVNLDNDIPHLYLYYIIMVINTAVSYLFVYKTCVFSADQKQYIITQWQLIINVFRTIIQIIVLLVFNSFILYLVLGVAATIAQNVIVTKKVDHTYPLKKDANELKNEDKAFIRTNISAMFAYKFASSIFSSTDNIIISMIFGTVKVGIYSNYLLIVQYLSNVVGNIFIATTASVGNSIVVDSPERRLKIFNTLLTASHMIGVFCSVELFLLINDFILCWLGSAYQFSTLIVCAIVFNFCMDCAFQPIWSYRNAAGIFLKLKYIMAFAAIANIVLSTLIGQFIGIAGVFFATAIARLFTYFWYEPRILYNDYFHVSSKRYFFGWLRYITEITLIIVIEEKLFSFLIVTNWLHWLLKAVLTSLITILIVYALYRKTDGYLELKEKLLSFLHRKVSVK